MNDKNQLSRRDFLKRSLLVGAGLLAAPSLVPNALMGADKKDKPVSYKSMRPLPGDRHFTSRKVEETIAATAAQIKDPKLAWQFANCYPCTLDTTVYPGRRNGHPDTFVITGDIDAMWLRDSSAQVFPYLPLAAEDPELKELLQGVIRRQTSCILIDPYANAFNREANGRGHQEDLTEMKPEIWERKWEIDSLCYPVRLAYHYWKATGDTSIFDAEWQQAMQLVYKTLRQEQRLGGTKDTPYTFRRETPTQTDTVPLNGYGNPIRPCGLIVSSFRPSDDATLFSFLVPSNMFAVVSLRQMAEIYREVIGDAAFARQCERFADEVDRAIKEHAVIEHPKYGPVYAFEVDGYGQYMLMDDANVPSLLAAPYLGYCAIDDPLYLNTRRLIWSLDNPYFFEGKAIRGIGGPHQGLDNVWPMSLILYALTSSDEKEIGWCIDTLSKVDADTGFMHETVDKDDPTKFTRSWFAWANTLFGELIIKVAKEHPKLIR